MSNYLMELAVIHSVLIFGYWLLLSKEKQHNAQRFYLLVSTVLALTIPLLKLPKIDIGSQGTMNTLPIQSITVDTISIMPESSTSTWNFDQLLWIYIIISGFLLCKLIGNILYLIHLESRSTLQNINGLKIRKIRNIKGSFTFFNWIFLGEEIDESQLDCEVILNHEKAHVSFRHTYDIVFFELFRVCFWWLPTAWFINREIKIIHEFQADGHVLKSFNLNHYSSILIHSTLKSNGLSLASSFHDGFIQIAQKIGCHDTGWICE